MSQHEQPPTRQIIVDDLDEAARKARELHGHHPPPAEPEANGAVTGLDDALNRRIYTWTSPFNLEIVVRFRRPKAGTDEMVYRVLGDQSTNTQLVRRYKALASIVSLGRNPSDQAYEVRQPNSDAKFTALRDRVGYVKDDVYDEPVNAFVFAYEIAMFPQQLEAIADAEASHLAPDDIKRIIAASGLEHAKK